MDLFLLKIDCPAFFALILPSLSDSYFFFLCQTDWPNVVLNSEQKVRFFKKHQNKELMTISVLSL